MSGVCVTCGATFDPFQPRNAAGQCWTCSRISDAQAAQSAQAGVNQRASQFARGEHLSGRSKLAQAAQGLALQAAYNRAFEQCFDSRATWQGVSREPQQRLTDAHPEAMTTDCGNQDRLSADLAAAKARIAELELDLQNERFLCAQVNAEGAAKWADADRRANRLSDEAGALATRVRDLEAEVGRLTLELRDERRRAKR